MTETKRCCGYKGEWACEEDYPDHILPIEIFSLDNRAASGRQSRCKGCQKLYDTIYNAKISEAIKLVGSQKAYRCMTREGRKEIFALLAGWWYEDRVTDSNVVDIQPKLKSEFGQSTPMTKRETVKVEGETVLEGWVYVVCNPDVPWTLKIGKTFPDGISDIMSSARRFGRAELVGKFWFEEAYKAEQEVHALLNYCNLRTLGRTDCGKELFKCTTEEAINAITRVQSENDRPSIAMGG